MSRVICIIVCMFKRCIYPILACILLFGCNNAYRASYTSISVTKPVADYLSNQTLTIHNNQPNAKTRKVQIQSPYTDTFYNLRFKKIAATTIILEISDSTGKIRNVAIPQTKLKAYPIAYTTTVTPAVSVLLLSSTPESNNPYYNNPYYINTAIATGITIFSAANDLIMFPITQLFYRNNQYTVPKTFVLRDIQSVTTLDTQNNEAIFEIALPINPNVTPYLDANYQKQQQIYIQPSIGYGLVHEKYNNSPGTSLPPTIWYNIECNVQSHPNLQWGLILNTTKHKDFQTSMGSMQLAYVNNSIKNGTLICGIGAGLGGFTRKFAPDWIESTPVFEQRVLGSDSLLMIQRAFVANQTHNYIPLHGFVQFEKKIGSNTSFTSTLRFTEITSFVDYQVQRELHTQEIIAPGFVANRTQEIGPKKMEVYNGKNLIFQLSAGLKIQINR